MEFIALETLDKLEEIQQAKGYSVILKHNTTCPISKGVLQRLHEEGDAIKVVDTIYVLDLLAHRDISDRIEEMFEVKHESPQLLLIKDGECILDQSHGQISVEEAVTVI